MPARVAAVGAGDEEGEVHHHVRAVERPLEHGLVTDVAPPVGHLVPAVLGGVERPAGHADHHRDAVVILQQRHEAEAEGAGRASDGDGEPRVGGHVTPSLASCRRFTSWTGGRALTVT